MRKRTKEEDLEFWDGKKTRNTTRGARLVEDRATQDTCLLRKSTKDAETAFPELFNCVSRIKDFKILLLIWNCLFSIQFPISVFGK